MTVVSYPGPNPSGLCMCGCGEPTTIPTYTNRLRDYVKGEPMKFIAGHNMARAEQPKRTIAADLVGQRFGTLVVKERAEYSKDRQVWWRCACDCGRFHTAQHTELLKGFATSCGCVTNARNVSPPAWPDGLDVLVCRPCRRVGLKDVRCACGAPTVKALVYNTPPRDQT